VTCAALTSRLPYTDRHGLTVDTRDGRVTYAGRSYSPVEALDLAAHLGRAVALIGTQRAASACPCTTNPNQTNPKEAAHG
jgi:hypothetical protein